MPELLGLLKEKSVDIPVVVGGSVIIPKDRLNLKKMGVGDAFGPSSSDEEIIVGIHEQTKRSLNIDK